MSRRGGDGGGDGGGGGDDGGGGGGGGDYGGGGGGDGGAGGAGFSGGSIGQQVPSAVQNEAFLEDLYSGRSFVKDETRIVLIGKTGSGKSATGNTLAGRRAFKSKFCGSSITRQCQQEMVRRFDRHIQIVDTPGLFDTGMTNALVSQEIMKCIAMTSPGLHAIVLVTGLNRFTEEENKTVQHFMQIFGENVLNYLVIVFTGKDNLDSHGMSIDTFVRDSPEPLRRLIAACQGRYYAVNNLATDTDKEAWTRSFLQEIDNLVQRNGGRCYTTDMYRKAEALMKHREQELKRKLEEEKKAEREKIEDNIKEKYDEITHDQDKKMQNLQKELQDMDLRGASDQKRHAEAVVEFQNKLENAESERKQIEAERVKWEEERRREMEKNEKDRDEAMLKMMDHMEEERRRREEETKSRMEAMEVERRQREADMMRMEEERGRREEEQRRRMEELEKEKQEGLVKMREEMKQESERQERMMEEMARSMAREETSGGGGILAFLKEGVSAIASIVSDMIPIVGMFKKLRK